MVKFIFSELESALLQRHQSVIENGNRSLIITTYEHRLMPFKINFHSLSLWFSPVTQFPPVCLISHLIHLYPVNDLI